MMATRVRKLSAILPRLAKQAVRIALVICTLAACSPSRPPIPTGTIPRAEEPSQEDEEYGQQVFRELSRRYPLDQDDAHNNRVHEIVDRLTRAARVDRSPWNAYVLSDSQFKNAAATRGNFIFVWNALLSDVQNDDELAAVLAHEIAHVLAGHTQPTAAEEVQSILSGVAGTVAGQVVAHTPYGALADLAELAMREAIAALAINPGQQRKELEADQIGIFIMAEAGYDPRSALDFWERVKDRPGYSGGPIGVLSSHPSSQERIEQIRDLLPRAEDRYLLARSPHAPNYYDGPPRPRDRAPSQDPSSRPQRPPPSPRQPSDHSEWVWQEAMPQ